MAGQGQPPKTDEEIEEEELQLALALSRSEAESKEKERARLRKDFGVYSGTNNSPSRGQSEPASQHTMGSLSALGTEDMDPELARYLNRNYWQSRSDEMVGTSLPSAPSGAPNSQSAKERTVEQNGQSAQTDKSQFLAALQSSLEIFVNRMRSNSQRGRPIANDTSVQSLFSVISSMHPQLLSYQQEMEDRRAYYEGLQDKLAQLRDAREALDSLREEHREKRRREMEELERQRQIQLMQKLDVMRQKKQEYLEMQRQVALQRLQEQEREMAMRLEQQKQLIHMRQMQSFGYPQMYGAQQQMGGPHNMMGTMPLPQGMPPALGPQGLMQGYMPAPHSMEGSPAHQLPAYSHTLPPHGLPATSEALQAPGAVSSVPGSVSSVPGGVPSIPGSIQSAQGSVPSVPGNVPGPIPSVPASVPAGPLQGPSSQELYMQPGLNQPGMYTQSPAGPGMQGTTSMYSPPPPPNTYHPQGQAPPSSHPQMDGGQTHTGGGTRDQYSTAPSYPDPGMVNMGPPSMDAYASMPPTMDYSPFNLHSLASSLPQPPPPAQPQQQQHQRQQQQGPAGNQMYPSHQPVQQPATALPSQQYLGGVPPSQYPANTNNSNQAISMPPHHFPMTATLAQQMGPPPSQPVGASSSQPLGAPASQQMGMVEQQPAQASQLISFD